MITLRGGLANGEKNGGMSVAAGSEERSAGLAPRVAGSEERSAGLAPRAAGVAKWNT
jgi:hypothetical protein